MPGREELIKQNIERAQASVNNASEQPPKAGETPSVPLHRSLMGANLDVVSYLETINFALRGPLGDGAMRNHVAYIRRWSRQGTKEVVQAASVDTTQIDPASDTQTEIEKAIQTVSSPNSTVSRSVDPEVVTSAVISDPAGTPKGTVAYIESDLIESEDRSKFLVETVTTYNYPDGTTSTSSEIAPYIPQTVSGDADAEKQRQDAIGTQTPTTKTSTGNSSSVADSSQKTIPEINEDAADQLRNKGVGRVKSANPNGFVDVLLNIGKRVLGLPPGQINYSGVAGEGGIIQKAGISPQGVWQFLFNPSELEIEAGPEFKVAETWGVSDKANSGQPLSWSHNKNAQLKFNSVLLNGYLFGRKVEELEQGIFELFMARDGGGQDGPPILEFVWGKRVFGPCVIKDISVKEKMWDEGQVVNAELSFTLEQIPEWTINDGYVDIARPGRIPNIYNVATGETQATDGTTPETPGTPETPNQKPPQQNQPSPATSGPSAQFCTQATNAYSNFNLLGSKSTQSWTDNVFGSPEARVRTLGIEYKNLISANGSLIRQLKGVNTKCSNGCPENLYYYTNTATLNTNAYLGCIRSCSYGIASKIQGSYLDNKSCPAPQFVRSS